jgi:hypothetical protein
MRPVRAPHRFATLLVLLALQLCATALVFRRDEEQRFHGTVLAALVWTALERGRPGPARWA